MTRPAALDHQVDGPVVLVSNDSCTAAYAEPGAPNVWGLYSCQINGGGAKPASPDPRG